LGKEFCNLKFILISLNSYFAPAGIHNVKDRREKVGRKIRKRIRNRLILININYKKVSIWGIREYMFEYP
jgi:hypothetical protein